MKITLQIGKNSHSQVNCILMLGLSPFGIAIKEGDVATFEFSIAKKGRRKVGLVKLSIGDKVIIDTIDYLIIK